MLHGVGGRILSRRSSARHLVVENSYAYLRLNRCRYVCTIPFRFGKNDHQPTSSFHECHRRTTTKTMSYPSSITTQSYSYPSCISWNQSIRFFSQEKKRVDPTAKRPTSACDPYGQGGKPLKYNEALQLLTTLDKGWELEILSVPLCSPDSCSSSSSDEREEEQQPIPISIYKEFHHENFIKGSQFISQMAAVGHNNNHFPHLTLERRLLRKEKAWTVVSTVKCTTPPLNGLSYNDFHIAMLIDVEVGRDMVQQLLVHGSETFRKHV